MPPKKIVGGGAKGGRPISAKATKVGAQVEAEKNSILNCSQIGWS